MKKILIIGAALAYGIYHFGGKKVTQVKNVIDQLVISVQEIRNVRISNGGVKFNINLNITNPTNQNLNLNTGQVVTLSKINFFAQNGDFLGESFPNLTCIQIPANGSVNIPNLETFVKVDNFGNLINNAIGLFTDPSRLKVTAELQALGQTYTI